MDLQKEIREVLDFPSKGINFKDITTLLKNAEAFRFATKAVVDNFAEKQITKVLGIESRGFIIGGAVAYELGAGFVPIRKKGKLPSATISETYLLEYGEDCIEVHADAINANDVVLIHDDLLATGGTAFAALQMVKRMNVKAVYFSFICDLEFIKTESKEKIKEYEIQVLVKYK